MSGGALSVVSENGPEFELRGILLARALHDPLGVQGAVMHKGQERDGLFVNHDSINAYEFTTLRTKDKALKDASKLAQLVRDVGAARGNGFKSRTGWFVTREEPTAEQRTAVQVVAKREGEQVHAISIATLQQRICNSEIYLQKRDNAPFGSIAFSSGHGRKMPEVAVKLREQVGDHIDVRVLTERLLEGRRALITGNYGAGKSHALREIYRQLRKKHLASGRLTAFPVHINLRDCAGLKTPAEILRRHAEEIGFDQADGLISAWRAGTCVLLLDGFDEIVPTRWLGGAIDLKTLRWESLSPVRRLVDETPPGSAIVTAGRAHYFSTQSELVSSLGYKSFDRFDVPDFDDAQLTEFLKQSGVEWAVPDWVPMRPLLLGYLASLGPDGAGDITAAPSRAAGWRRFFDAICEREAKMFQSVRPEVIQNIIARVSTLARARGEGAAVVDSELLRNAFVMVNGRQPDEEGMQLLLRLPGLAEAPGADGAETRVFADIDLADTAYGLDLANYVLTPYGDVHALSLTAAWASASTELGIEVAADSLAELQVGVGNVAAALGQRESNGQYDAVSADLVRVAAELPAPARKNELRPVLVSDVYFERLVLTNHDIYSQLNIQDCVIASLDMTFVDEGAPLPTFRGCIIGLVDGVPSFTSAVSSHFIECEVEKFASPTQTTSGFLSLQIDRQSAVALTILKKIFAQRGSGRKIGALYRGLPLADRALVDPVVDLLVAQDFIFRSGTGNSLVYVGVKERRRDALAALDRPLDFRLN
jgi:hypothetical protein